MKEQFTKMIGIINELADTVEKLSDIQKDIIDAVSKDDLAKLAECMKHEQVCSMNIRSVEQKRIKLQKEMGLDNVKLSEMPDKAPDADTQIEIRNAADRLKAQYKIMKAASGAARFRLECSLRRVEQIMDKAGIDPTQTDINSVGGMHKDFRV